MSKLTSPTQKPVKSTTSASHSAPVSAVKLVSDVSPNTSLSELSPVTPLSPVSPNTSLSKVSELPLSPVSPNTPLSTVSPGMSLSLSTGTSVSLSTGTSVSLSTGTSVSLSTGTSVSVSPPMKVSTSVSDVSMVKPVSPSSQSRSKVVDAVEPVAKPKPPSWKPPGVTTETVAAFHPSPSESLPTISYSPGVAVTVNVTVSSSKSSG